MSSSLYFSKFVGFPLKFNFGTAGLPGTNLNVVLSLNIRQDNQETLNEEDMDKTTAAYELPTRFVNVVYQDYINLYSWQDVTRVLFMTSLPVYPEDYTFPNPQNPGQKYTQLILTDYDVPPSRVHNQRDRLFYYANGDDRYFNFTSSSPLLITQVKIYFQLNDLSIYPVMLQPNEELLVKMRFIRRISRSLLEY
jgi:hypothetical protein